MSDFLERARRLPSQDSLYLWTLLADIARKLDTLPDPSSDKTDKED